MIGVTKIDSNNAEWLFVRVPIGAKDFQTYPSLLNPYVIDMFNSTLTYSGKDFNNGYCHLQGYGIQDLKLVSLASAITPKQIADIVEGGHSSTTTYFKPENLDGWEETQNGSRKTWTHIDRTFYKDYAAKQVPRSFSWQGEVDTALKSFQSILTYLQRDLSPQREYDYFIIKVIEKEKCRKKY